MITIETKRARLRGEPVSTDEEFEREAFPFIPDHSHLLDWKEPLLLEAGAPAKAVRTANFRYWGINE